MIDISLLQKLLNDEKYQEAQMQLQAWKEETEYQFTDTVAVLEGSILMGQQKWSQALDVIYQGLQINPCNHELYFMLGQIKEIQGKERQAQFSFENAMYYSSQEDYETMYQYYQQFCASATKKPNKVSIVILTYNQLEYTKLCLDSIRCSTPKNTYEIIVVDNLSTDGTREWLQEQKDIRYILNDENKGFPAGCNQGAKLAEKGNDIFLLNNDTIVMQNSIYNLRMALYEREKTGAVGAVTNQGGGRQVVTKSFATIEESTKYAEKNNAYSPDRHDRCLHLVGFALLVRGDVWKGVGGFDEQYGKGNFEDDDLCLKMLTHNYDILFCKDSFIYHFGSVSFRAAKKQEPDLFHNLMEDNSALFNQKWNIQWSYFSHVRLGLIEKIERKREEEFSILEAGCGSGATLLEIQNQYPNAVTYGFEINKTVVDIASHYLNIIQGDIEEKKNYFQVQYDYILLGDVLEHIHNPEDVLNAMKGWLKPGGRFIISLPNIMHISVLFPLLHGRFEYKDAGILDRTHLKFFTKYEVVLLMQTCGLEIERIGGFILTTSPQEKSYIRRLHRMDDTIPEEELSIYQYWVVAQVKSDE